MYMKCKCQSKVKCTQSVIRNCLQPREVRSPGWRLKLKGGYYEKVNTVKQYEIVLSFEDERWLSHENQSIGIIFSPSYTVLLLGWSVKTKTCVATKHQKLELTVSTQICLCPLTFGVITVSYSLWSRQFREMVPSQLLKPVCFCSAGLNRHHFKDAFCLMPIISAITLDRKNVTNSDTSPDCRNKNPVCLASETWVAV